MAFPPFNMMHRPILALAAEKAITRADAAEAMASHFNLSEEEQNARISGGATYVRHRVGWAMLGLTKAG